MIDEIQLEFNRSLSARRAWIEILTVLTFQTFPPVALRKESVDRNKIVWSRLYFTSLSLSARRAWIEMSDHTFGGQEYQCRSPQGERG